MNLSLLPHLYLANTICKALSILGLPVRVHSRIAVKGYAWARLWYFLRGIDQQGRGRVDDLAIEEICFWLDCGESTIYQWLREGMRVGAFQKWRCRNKKLGVIFGGLLPLCRNLNLEEEPSPPTDPKTRSRKNRQRGIPPWGATAEVQLIEILSLEELRAIATGATVQRLQQLSRYAAWRKLPKNIRLPHPGVTLHLPQPTEFFDSDELPSRDSAIGGINFVLKITEKWISTSKGFTPYGTSQATVAKERGYSTVTVQRHLKAIGMKSKQIIQSKAAYGKIRQALHWSSMSFAPEPDIQLIYSVRSDSYKLTEPSGGRHGDPYTFPISKGRMFKHGDREYIYRQSLYKPLFKLCKMTATRKAYSDGEHTTKNLRALCSTGCSKEVEVRDLINEVTG